MSRPKKPDARVHITATISQANNAAVKKYCDDEKNRDQEGNKPTKSKIIDDAIGVHLRGYL